MLGPSNANIINSVMQTFKMCKREKYKNDSVIRIYTLTNYREIGTNDLIVESKKIFNERKKDWVFDRIQRCGAFFG